ncbi:hypothetical protein BJ165DRAFT_1405550 [Panaeolus papilionaceus]|nr:hypothetical protein BJ165DRAFT_1405550 [Panaeolus papilionaceus]
MTTSIMDPHISPQPSHHTFKLPIERFFRRYETDSRAPFTYAPPPSHSAPANFRRLCAARGLSSKSEDPAVKKGLKKLRKKYNRALVDQFNELYGKDDNIEGWQDICRITGTADPPNDIEACKAIMKITQVNLIDLTEWIGDENTPTVDVFETLEDLATYSFKEGKVFPRGVIHAGDVLEFFLRRIRGAQRSEFGPPVRKRRVRTRRRGNARR